MRTAAELEIRMAEARRKLDGYLYWYGEAIAEAITRPMIRRLQWQCRLRAAADATRHQLTWNGK